MKPYYEDKWVKIFHGDCRDILPQLDKVDLVLTDPPYGLNTKMQGGTWGIAYKHSDMAKWDYAVSLDLLSQVISLARISIVWGGNNYALPPSRCWLVWDKLVKVPTLSDVELAWTNMDKPCKSFSTLRESSNGNKRHPTEKPESLIAWSIVQAGDGIKLILDPFLGSGTTCFCAKKLNRYSIGIEIEEKYCEIAARRCCQDVMELV